ncbi:hypothetical protein [Halodesulfovibrio sp.]|jgi:hypothetical protein|uniref:hypothetical protein n=1 Tax=Halodesulfovibrio sp. TaxID=1912772 RepID=UPI0025CC815B|nr:hypothetical protein [Halodesulfovibrio sp.]MCT4625838.1 hypothetical protein [Halodesulfovibrio sp.]
MPQLRLNLDPQSVTIRRCLHTEFACNKCNQNQTRCRPIKIFSVAQHGVDGARKLAEEHLRTINPNGAAAKGKNTFTRYLGTCADKNCHRYISEGDEYYTLKNRIYCKYCGLGIEEAQKVSPSGE